MLIEYREWLKSTDGRAVYELVQIHRAFSLMHLQRNLEARPLLEEATDFQLDAEVRSNVHCHLGRCYHELSLYLLARKQFEYANALGISEEWQAVFRYYYGYSLYELKEFQRAKREFILACSQALWAQNRPCDIQCLRQQVGDWENIRKPKPMRNKPNR